MVSSTSGDFLSVLVRWMGHTFPSCRPVTFQPTTLTAFIMQGMVDHLYRFTDIYIGWPGRVHDARVFGNSTLYQKGVNGTLFPEWTKTIAQEEIPLVVLGDPAYLPWVMKPYIDNGHLSRDQRRFNYRLSRARVVVEDVYGRLKGRWRCLSKRY